MSDFQFGPYPNEIIIGSVKKVVEKLKLNDQVEPRFVWKFISKIENLENIFRLNSENVSKLSKIFMKKFSRPMKRKVIKLWANQIARIYLKIHSSADFGFSRNIILKPTMNKVTCLVMNVP